MQNFSTNVDQAKIFSADWVKNFIYESDNELYLRVDYPDKELETISDNERETQDKLSVT